MKGAPIGNCKGCGGKGRVTLVTADDLGRCTPKKLTKLTSDLTRGRARLVRPSELVDPYFVKKKG